MQFSSADKVVQTVQQMKLFDLPRSKNRALIDALFNGMPPYTAEEAAENQIKVNYNDLSATKLAHDARAQFYNAILSPQNYFTVRLDYGKPWKRQEWSEIITTEINRRMKRNRLYSEVLRDVFRQVVIHGIGPVVWNDQQSWVPQMQMVPDVMLPSRTLLTLDNVEYFGVYRRYTAAQLYRMTHGAKVDPGWNVALARKCIEWAAKQYGATLSSNDYIYTPEKWEEDIKSDQGWYATDALPTIDCWDFYFLNDSHKNMGWNRRIVLDTPSGPDGGIPIPGAKNQFLYDSGARKYARKMDEIIHFQFANGAVVAPARYHSVRSLGFLLYSVCHIANRLNCRLTAHAFESLLQYFRVANPDDAERMTKIDLIDRGIIPDGVSFVGQQERWQINADVVSAVTQRLRETMADQSTSYTQQHDYASRNKEKTATQVMAEVNAASSLVGGMLNDAYGYQQWQYVEIARRFCVRNSKDLDVREFRLGCLKQGVPEEALNVDAWDIQPEKIMGGGNRQMAIAQSQLIMETYSLFDPDAQRYALRNRIFAITGDASLTNILVPQQRTQVTQSVHDAQVSAAAMLAGLPVGLKQGVNHAEYAQTLLTSMAAVINKIEARGGMATNEEIIGLTNLAGQTVDGQPLPGNGVFAHIQIVAQDDNAKQVARELSDQLGKVQNKLKAYIQRMAEQAQAQNGNGNGAAIEMEAQAKVQSMVMQSQTKAQIAQANAAQKLQQKQAQFSQKMQQDSEKHQLEMSKRITDAEVDTAITTAKTAADIRRENAKAEAKAENSTTE